MTTFLGALRFAVNVETALSELQRRRFSMTGDTSTRLLPPLVPIATSPGMPDENDLDRMRKKHYLVHQGTEGDTTIAESSVDSSRAMPPAGGYTLRIEGFAALQDELVEGWGVAVPGSPFFPERSVPVVGANTSDGPTPPDGPILRLGWGPGPDFPVLTSIPRTAAFWLTIFEVIPGEGDPWWNGAQWWLRYSRRLTSRRESPGSARPASRDRGRRRPPR
ncbi:MAG: hypothetical protein ACLFR8_02850 [Alkalispirochaeta sp.]